MRTPVCFGYLIIAGRAASVSYLAMRGETAKIVLAAACLRLTLIKPAAASGAAGITAGRLSGALAAPRCPHYREDFFHDVKNSHYTFEKSSR